MKINGWKMKFPELRLIFRCELLVFGSVFPGSSKDKFERLLLNISHEIMGISDKVLLGFPEFQGKSNGFTMPSNSNPSSKFPKKSFQRGKGLKGLILAPYGFQIC